MKNVPKRGICSENLTFTVSFEITLMTVPSKETDLLSFSYLS
jgi:hypothetical protein